MIKKPSLLFSPFLTKERGGKSSLDLEYMAQFSYQKKINKQFKEIVTTSTGEKVNYLKTLIISSKDVLDLWLRH